MWCTRGIGRRTCGNPSTNEKRGIWELRGDVEDEVHSPNNGVNGWMGAGGWVGERGGERAGWRGEGPRRPAGEPCDTVTVTMFKKKREK